MVISTKDFELPQQMQHESWSQWINVCKCDVSSLVQAVQKITICALLLSMRIRHLCTRRKETFFLNCFKHVWDGVASYFK